MDIVQQVAASLNVDESKAERGVGAILAALRTSIDRDTFDRVKATVPSAERLMGRALMSSSARTGEMPALGGPKGLLVALAAAGYDKNEIPSLGTLVLDALRPALGDAAAKQFLAGAPALQG